MITVAFIDPLISPEAISSGLKAHGMKSVGVYQTQHIQNPELQDRIKQDIFDEVVYIESDDSTESILKKLKDKGVNFLFNGYDTSCALTDALAKQLHPEFANPLESSNSRFNKNFAQAQLIQAGIPVPRHAEILTEELSPKLEAELAHWHFPVILKPSDSYASAGYIECENIEQVKKGLKSRLSSIRGHEIRSYIIQEKLIGQEYAIDTFSLKGQHQLVHLRKYEKEYFTGVPISRRTDSIAPTHPDCQRIFQYMQTVLDAIELKNGFCHTELFVTANGIFAIDINPRLPGSRNSSCLLAKDSWGYSHMDVLCNALLEKSMPAKKFQPGSVLYLQNLSPRIIGDIQTQKISHLPSFKKCIPNVDKAQMMSLPNKLTDTVAFVVLCHSELNQIAEDSQFIFDLEKKLELF